MAKVKVIKSLLKGIGSLFKEKGEAVPKLFKTPTKDPELPARSFFTHLIDDFGEAEVKEATRITTDAWKKNTFFPGGPKGASFEDDLVNLLETRYMGSSRLQAHPLSFNRRGPGAADRYKMPKMGEEVNPNIRRTDLPGGPGDPDIYKGRWGEMSDTTLTDGTKVHSGKASILDEYADDTIKKIKNNENVSPEDINMAYDEKMMARIRKAADEQLAPMKLQTKQMNAAAQQIDDMTARMEEFARKGDMENAGKIQKAIEEFRLQVQKDRGMLVDEFPMLIDPTRKPNAAGGRVGMFAGGKLIGEGIMQAAKLAKKGIKPWGSKQTHRQKVTKTGAINFDTIENIIKTDIESSIDAGDLRSLVEQYESILSGKTLGLLNTPQREKILKMLEEGMAKTSDKFDTKGITSQLREYYDLGKIKGTAKILPFKPRQKKFKGGLMELLKRTVNPKSIKAASETKGPFKTGHRADYIADADQLKSIIRKEATDLDDIHVLEDMIQNDPRYGKQARNVFLRLIQREKLRANMIYDDPRAAKWAEADSEGFDRFLEQIIQNDPTAGDFNQGGRVGVGSLFRRKT